MRPISELTTARVRLLWYRCCLVIAFVRLATTCRLRTQAVINVDGPARWENLCLYHLQVPELE